MDCAIQPELGRFSGTEAFTADHKKSFVWFARE